MTRALGKLSMFRHDIALAACFGLLLAFAVPATAEVVTIRDETPTVTVDVPSSFEASQTDRGIQLKTPDGEEYVWFETYSPDQVDTLIKEHEDYWTKNDVSIGDESQKDQRTFGDKTVIATDYKAATWKGKPTVIRYLFIDAALPSKKLILMSLWASPEGDKEHDSEISDMIGSLKIKE